MSLDLSTKEARSLVTSWIRSTLDQAEWESHEDDPELECRRCYLGSILSIYPSGKYYTPWACSNVAPCPSCDGSGLISSTLGRRRAKKIKARLAHNGCKLRGLDRESPRAQRIRAQNGRLSRILVEAQRCSACRGYGSVEAYRDALFGERLEALCDNQHWSVESGEGDPCDLFITEFRSKE